MMVSDIWLEVTALLLKSSVFIAWQAKVLDLTIMKTKHCSGYKGLICNNCCTKHFFYFNVSFYFWEKNISFFSVPKQQEKLPVLDFDELA